MQLPLDLGPGADSAVLYHDPHGGSVRSDTRWADWSVSKLNLTLDAATVSLGRAETRRVRRVTPGQVAAVMPSTPTEILAGTDDLPESFDEWCVRYSTASVVAAILGLADYAEVATDAPAVDTLVTTEPVDLTSGAPPPGTRAPRPPRPPRLICRSHTSRREAGHAARPSRRDDHPAAVLTV
ncbi:MAG: hypothetical protein ACYCS4_11130 [Acidimicrobiales bacterium]